jgi:hypothetical protein
MRISKEQFFDSDDAIDFGDGKKIVILILK